MACNCVDGRPPIEKLTKDRVLQLHNIADMHKYVGVKCDLYTKKDMVSQEWDYSLPTFTCLNPHSIPNSHTSLEVLNKHLGVPGFVIAGETLSIGLINYNVYMVEVQDKKEEMVKKFSDIVNKELKFPLIHHTSVCWTWRNGETVIRLFAHQYSTISELVHSFDIGAYQVAYDGATLYLSSMGLLAFSIGKILLNENCCSEDLAKCYNNGFGLIVPENLYNTSRRLIYLAQNSVSIYIESKSGLDIKTSGMMEHSNTRVGDFPTDVYILDETMIRHNIRNFVRNKCCNLVAVGLFDTKPYLTKEKIISEYETLAKIINFNNVRDMHSLSEYFIPSAWDEITHAENKPAAVIQQGTDIMLPWLLNQKYQILPEW
jgi:hypothetical protein